MKVGLVGQSYQEWSLNFDAQRTVNLYPVVDQSGKEVAALYGTPGIEEFAQVTLVGSAATGASRGMFTSANGRCFSVNSNRLYEVFEDGTTSSLALLGTTVSNSTEITSPVTMDENGQQLVICDGESLFIYTYGGTVSEISDPDFPGAATVCFMDGFFCFNDPDSGQFYISALYDGSSVDALDFATAESAPDDLVRVIKCGSILFLMGKNTIEPWANQGGGDFPFARIDGGVMDVGCAAAHSVAILDNSLFWLGSDRRGSGVVYRVQGMTPQRISTHAIELILSRVTDLSSIRGYTYQKNGHLFYVMTGGGLLTTLVYDVSTGMWHERAYLNDSGEWECQLGVTCTFAFGKHLVGDRLSNKIYEMHEDIYSDNGREIKRQRTFTHINNEGKRARLSELQVDFEYGVGLTSGQGSDPVANLEVSTDGGHDFGNMLPVSIGKKGDRKARAVWRRLGYGSQFTFRLTISDPVKVAICGAYLR